MASVVGVASWFCLLSRSHFSVFDEVYAFARKEDGDTKRILSHACIDELLCFACLVPCLSVGVARPFCNTLIASDASPSSGFGVSIKECEGGLTEALSLKSERFGDLVRMQLDTLDEPEKERHGQPFRLPFTQDAFTDVISIKASHKAHSGGMECHAALLGLQWALRPSSRLGTRMVFCIDAKAVLVAISKGRSSAPTLRGPVRSFGAQCRCADVAIYALYVPSESNPADNPSIGKRRRAPLRRVLKPRGDSKLDKHLQQLRRSVRRLKEFGHLPWSDSDSECSW